MTDLRSIKSVAAELGLSVSRIRQLTDDGVFAAERTVGGHRRYDVEATRSAWLRYRLNRAGLPTDGVGPAVPTIAPVFEREFELDGLAEDRVSLPVRLW